MSSVLNLPLNVPKYKDYYELLSIKKENITDAKIKKAFMKKALLWHPDKAKSEAEAEIFTKVYEELQQAYKLLSTEESRKKYNNVKQSTAIDLITEDRDRLYERDAKYTKLTSKGYEFNRDAFLNDFKHKIITSTPDILNNEDSDTNNIYKEVSSAETENNFRQKYEKYLNAREEDISVQNFKFFSTENFDRNKFHQSFDFIKEQSSKGKGLQECSDNPVAYCENDYLVNENTNTLNDGFFGNLSEYSKALTFLKTSEEQYGVQDKLDSKICEEKIQNIECETNLLKNLTEFSKEESEMDKLYSSFFTDAQNKEKCEGLEAPKSELKLSSLILEQKREDILLNEIK